MRLGQFKWRNFLTNLSVTLALLAVTATQAQAIECKDGYQRVRGDQLATPYCQDAYLAEVASTYGMKASAAKIRNNPNFKREICRFIGHDIRVQSNCQQELPSGRSGRF